MSGDSRGLKVSAGSALIWSVVFNFGRDVIQFSSMLILVRLLSPQIYGQFALAQTIQLFLAVASFKTIASFALQARDPSRFDWDIHFSAGVTLNTVVTALTLIIATVFYVYGNENFHAVGVVLALMALVFPIEMIGTLYFTWLQAFHEWRRMRTLLLLGALIGPCVSVAMAAMGAGIFALAIGNLIFALPLILDYFLRKPFKLRFRRDWYSQYQAGRSFCSNRIAAASLQAGSTLAEHSIISNIFGFSILGIYTRAFGLAQITSGRVGPVVTQTLYPVLTRADAATERFRRFAGILFQGVLWTSFPAAAFLVIEADQLVQLLYGEKWLDVIPLIGAASTLLVLRGLNTTMNQIMVANLQQQVCLRIDIIATVTMLGVVLSTVFMGPRIYLVALCIHAGSIFLVTAYLAWRGGAINATHLIRVVVSCFISLFIASACLISLPEIVVSNSIVSVFLSLGIHGIIFSAVYIFALRVTAIYEMLSIIEVIPLQRKYENLLYRLFILPGRVK